MEETKIAQQSEWRFCRKCQELFFNGFSSTGVCPAGGGHEAAGFNFVLPHVAEETPNAQHDFRFCRKCREMFFNGFPNKGVCPAGGTHQAAGFNFVLPHDVPETQGAPFFDSTGALQPGALQSQQSWRFCHKCEAIFFDGLPTKGACAAGGAHESEGFNFVLPHDVPGDPTAPRETLTAQQSWRFCRKCEAMFFDGFQDKGVCAAGGAHEAAGFNFVLPHGGSDTPTVQQDWRFCRKCQALVFDELPEKGVCAAGGSHEAAGFVFAMPHDIAETADSQPSWRFCRKCQAMFFDGLPQKGVCAAGGAHEAAGFNFVLTHGIVSFDSGRLSSDHPLAGSAQVVMKDNGDFTFTCDAHDSGFDNIDYVVSAVLVTTSGIAFTFQHAGGVEGTVSGLPFGTPRRDDHFTQGGNNGEIISEFDGISTARWLVSIDGTDTTLQGLEAFLADLIKKAFETIVEKGVVKLIGV
jgi:hypothetical protein